MSKSGSKRVYIYLGIGLGFALFPTVRKRVLSIVGANLKINQGLEEFKESMVMSIKSGADSVRKRIGGTQDDSNGYDIEPDEFPKYII